MAEAAYLESKLHLTSPGSARFSWGGRDYLGEPLLDEERAVMLLSLAAEPETYGRELFDAVFPASGELREGLREALVAAEQDKSRLRLLLHLSPGLPEWVHALFWELLFDERRNLALARSPDTAFSRYLSVRQAPGLPAAARPRLLCAVAAPSDLGRFNLPEIRRDEVVRRLRASLSVLGEAVEVTLLEPPVTLENLRRHLTDGGGFHLLHFFGHGKSRGGLSALLLEDEQGLAKPVEEDVLGELFLGVRELRLVTLVACHGGALSSCDPFSGLAGRLVQRGVPAVVAMCREVRVEDAHVFTDHLYRHLARTGQVDAAVNEARHQLYLADPRGIAWSSPVLYSRLADGRLWRKEPRQEAAPGLPRVRRDGRRLRRPWPWLPAALFCLLVGLARTPAPTAEAAFDLQVSQAAFRLAANARVVERLELRQLAATQLGDLRLPAPLPAATRGASGGLRGLSVTAREGARLSLDAQPFPAGTEVFLEHQGDDYYRLAFARSAHDLRATLQGDILLQLPRRTPVSHRFDLPESLVLYPLSEVAELDLAFARFAPDALAAEIPVDRLGLERIVEQHTAETTLVRKESTVLGGEVTVLTRGDRYRLKPGESLRFSAITGSLSRLHLGTEGIRLGFRGRVSGLVRTVQGLEPENLMPSRLDLWLPAGAQPGVLGTAGALAALVPLLALLSLHPRRASPYRPTSLGKETAL